MLHRAAKLLIFSLLLLFAVIFLFPVLITLTNSFMSVFEAARRYSAWFSAANTYDAGFEGIHYARVSLTPDLVTLKQYTALLFGSPLYLGLFLNSIKLTAPIIAGQVIISVPAAYAFETSRLKFKEALYFIYVVIMLLPLQVTLVPNFIMAGFLNMNGYLAIIIPAVFSPFGVFLVRQNLKGIPGEYAEAAKIDGAGHVKIFIYIILPLIKGAVASLSILVFIEYWNVVDQAVIFIKESVHEPLSVYLSRLAGEGGGVIFAASCFYMFPTLLVFLYGQEYMAEGIQLSGIK
ncbi:MAG: carbohydrate ABC transporter permease [Clostridiales bacterium]|jgi:multiple sugar transport system permease protein|nr:carbohydrate ABC transporter permease [Clostridiales bacterium]